MHLIEINEWSIRRCVEEPQTIHSIMTLGVDKVWWKYNNCIVSGPNYIHLGLQTWKYGNKDKSNHKYWYDWKMFDLDHIHNLVGELGACPFMWAIGQVLLFHVERNPYSGNWKGHFRLSWGMISFVFQCFVSQGWVLQGYVIFEHCNLCWIWFLVAIHRGWFFHLFELF